MASEADVVAMAQKISSIVKQENWKVNSKVVYDLQDILSKLTMLQVDLNLLKRTNIGKMVTKLKKHENDVVRGYSTTLTKKWKAQIGVTQPEVTAITKHNATSSDISSRKYESARKRIQENYAQERAKKDSRTIQMINGPIAKKNRGTKISATTFHKKSCHSTPGNSLLRKKLQQNGTTNTIRVVPASRIRSATASKSNNYGTLQTRRTANTKPMTAEEKHAFRMSKYRNMASSDGSARSEKINVPRPGSAPAKAITVDPRKAFLDKKYPRICGSENISALNQPAKKTRIVTAKCGQSGKPAATLSEGQREVIQWLKGLAHDMSEYAPAFFENGFDSIQLLSTIEAADLPQLVPKKGHHRMISNALDNLKKRNSTQATCRSSSLPASKANWKKLQRKRHSDTESEDSFVVSDGDEYAPGAITAMFRKNRGSKRRYSYDSDDSLSMEASFSEIQREEERSKRHGEYEDLREELRNEKLEKLKKRKLGK